MKICNEGTEPKKLRVCDLEPGTVFTAGGGVRMRLSEGNWCSPEDGYVFEAKNNPITANNTAITIYPQRMPTAW